MRESCQVAIVGAGPVGTFAAYCLAEHGIDVVVFEAGDHCAQDMRCLLYTSPSPRDRTRSRMPSSA